MAAIFTTLFWCALQVSLFLLLAAPIYLLVRRRNPAAGTAVAASALAAVVVLSALAISPWPRWSLEWSAGTRANAERAAAEQGGVEVEGNAPRIGDESPTPTAFGDDSLLAAFWRAAQYNDEAATPSAPGAAVVDNRVAWPSWIVWTIAAGVVLGAAHLIVSLAAVRRLITRSTPLDDSATQQELDHLRRQLDVTRPISLHVSAEISTPATVGMFQPAIILPTTWTTWTAVERRAVLAHELAHIAGRDFAAWLVARGAVVLHFYHPLVRWFVGRLQLDQELAADDTAARLLGDRKAYLQALASLALVTPHERLAGSLRTFIPTRSLLVRRVEMLRTNESRLASNRTRSKWRWATLPLVGALALLAAGLRPSAPASAVAAEQPAGAVLGTSGAAPAPANAEDGAEQDAKANSPQAAAEGFDFSYVPDGALFVIAVRPDVIASSPQLQPLADLLERSMSPQIPFSSLSQLTFVMPRPASHTVQESAPGSSYEYTLVRTKEPFDFKKALSTRYGVITEKEHHGRLLLTQNSGGSITFYSPDERRLISYSETGLRGVIDNPQADASPAEAAAWNREAKGPIFINVDLPAVKAMNIGLMGGPPLQMFQPIIDLADGIFITIEDQDPLVLHMRVACKSAEDAAAVEKTLSAALVLVENVVDTQLKLLEQQLPESAQYQSGRDIVELLVLGRKILDTAKVRVDGASVNVTASVDDPKETISKSLVPQLRRARQAAQEAQALNNLKQIGLAAHIFESRFRKFPNAVFYGKSSYGDLNKSGDGATDVPRSWRVEILPLIGEEKLYQEYRLDQPWDSEANLAVLKKMPAMYRSPSQPAESTNAAYFGIVGPGTIFGGKEGIGGEQIIDGAASTLLFVEAERDIPWTKPQDVEFDPDQTAPALGGWGNAKFGLVYADGSAQEVAVDAFKSEAGRTNFQRLVQFADGGEVDRLRTP